MHSYISSAAVFIINSWQEPRGIVMDISVVLPVMNEARTCGRCSRSSRRFSRARSISYEILVIDGNSTDGTARSPRHSARE